MTGNTLEQRAFSRADKAKAHRKLNHAVRKGLLVRPDACEKCGKSPPPRSDGRTRIQGHHHDYAKPLDVEWLCQDCHAKDTPMPHGESHCHARLTDETVRLAKVMRRRGMPYQEIGDRLGVDKKTVERAIKGERWKHVEDAR